MLSIHTPAQIEGWNDCLWTDREHTKLNAQQSQTIDETARKSIVDKMQQIFYAAVPYAILACPFQLEACNNAAWQGWGHVPSNASGGRRAPPCTARTTSTPIASWSPRRRSSARPRRPAAPRAPTHARGRTAQAGASPSAPSCRYFGRQPETTRRDASRAAVPDADAARMFAPRRRWENMRHARDTGVA